MSAIAHRERVWKWGKQEQGFIALLLLPSEPIRFGYL